MTRCPTHGNRIQLTPSGAVNLFGAPLNQIVIGHGDQLQAVTQAKGAQQMVAVWSWRGGGSTGGHRPCQRHHGDTGQSMHDLHCFSQSSRASRSPRPGVWVYCGSTEEPCVVSTLPRIDLTQRVSSSTRNDFGFLCGRRRVLLLLGEDPPI